MDKLQYSYGVSTVGGILNNIHYTITVNGILIVKKMKEIKFDLFKKNPFSIQLIVNQNYLRPQHTPLSTHIAMYKYRDEFSMFIKSQEDLRSIYIYYYGV